MLCIAWIESKWYKTYCGDTKDGGVKMSVVRAKLLEWSMSPIDLEHELS
jgi:hypothetical protein